MSQATGLFGDSSMGGGFGVELRQAGYDALTVMGEGCRTQLYLYRQ